MLRSIITLLLGNAIGWGAYRLALFVTPRLWESIPQPNAASSDFGLSIIFTALTAILFAAPPVIIGALSAAFARRGHLLIGLGVGIWSFGFAAWWPADVPLLPPEAWLAPTTLVLLSGLVGAWLVDNHFQIHRQRQRHDVESPTL